MSLSKPAIGIDLGTTYSAVAVFRNGIAEIIQNDHGNRITPSCVGFTQTERIVGEGAIYQAADNPENTIYGIKRLLGRKIDDEAIQNDIRSWPFKVMQDGSANAKIEVNFKGSRKTFFPEEISAAVLQKMKKTAENYLGTKIKDVVITCPAYFNNGQRQTTKDAAEIAGLNVLRLINEPTAAAMAYGLNVSHTDRKNLLIFDFGGGTFDVSIITTKDKKYIVRAVNGDTHLGGEDIDQRMVDYFVKEFREKNNRDISGDKGLLRLLKTHCERAKKVLSGLSATTLLLEGTDLKGQITRAKLEELNYDYFEKTVELVVATLADAEMDKKEIDEVILVGGSSRIPKVREMITELFDGKILNQSINPDEAVALGAAVQAGILLEDGSSRLKGLKLTDVCPLSLGTKLHDGSFEVIIKRNTALPAKKSSKFYNAYDNQTTMDVEIYEGERFLAQDNHFLAEFKMSDIPPMDRATACIEDTYEIDANGILKVTATVLASGVTQSLTISDNSRTKPIDAKKLALDAEQFHEEDAKHQARLFALNAFETYVYHLKRLTRTLPVAKRAEATELLKKMEEWLGGNPHETKEKFETMKAKLETAWNQMQ